MNTKILLVVGCLLAFAAASVARADETSDLKAKLEALRKQMDAIAQAGKPLSRGWMDCKHHDVRGFGLVRYYFPANNEKASAEVYGFLCK